MVTSNAKTIDVNKALADPANILAIPIKAQVGKLISLCGKKYKVTIPNAKPVAPPMVNKGANVPPEVPLPREIDQETNFNTPKPKIICKGTFPVSRLLIFE